MAQRKQHTGQLKARVAVEAIAGHKTVNQIAGEYGIHPSQVNKWKRQALERLPEALSDGRGGNNERQEELESRLYQQIGQLTMELDDFSCSASDSAKGSWASETNNLTESNKKEKEAKRKKMLLLRNTTL